MVRDANAQSNRRALDFQRESRADRETWAAIRVYSLPLMTTCKELWATRRKRGSLPYSRQPRHNRTNGATGTSDE